MTFILNCHGESKSNNEENCHIDRVKEEEENG